MTHAIHRVEHFEIVGPYTLALRFEDGSEQRIDFRAVYFNTNGAGGAWSFARRGSARNVGSFLPFCNPAILQF